MSDDPLKWNDDRFLTRDEACAYTRSLGLRLQPATLAKYASNSCGPTITYFGAKPLYQLADLRAWLLSRLRKSSSTARPPRTEPALKPTAPRRSATSKNDEKKNKNDGEKK